MNEKPLFLSGLNGIRAIGACAVLLHHLNQSLIGFNIVNLSLFGFLNNKPITYGLGEHGVTMFFVLSGFLITFLLLKEFQKTKTIEIKKFYVRRILRIWPLYFFYIMVTTISAFFLLDAFHLDSNIIYYLFFTANIPFVNGENYEAMYHLWSIGVEEQFYIFWPLLFIFLIKRQYIYYLIVIIILFSLFRIGIWYYMPFSKIALYSVVNRFDCMLFGALGAYLLFKNHNIIKILNSKINQIFCWSILFLLIINKFWFLNKIIEIFVVEYITLGIIIGQIKGNNKLLNLEINPLTYLGKISFGIYVYHPLIILICAHYFKYSH